MDGIFKFICCGNVDDGKSTLIGRLLLDTGNVKKDQLEDAKRFSDKKGENKLELSALLDGLLEERQQQITIDVAHRYFDYSDIRFHILDCPGHVQYTKNMAIAAAETDMAIVVVDYQKGISEQTKEHIRICSLFQLKRICVCLTKCDLILSDETKALQAIETLTHQVQELLNQYSFDYTIIPVSAVTGYNIEKVLSVLVENAKISLSEKKLDQQMIMHIASAQLYHDKRYYYGKILTAKTPEMNEIYTVYPKGHKITVSDIVSHGCVCIKENIDIGTGFCISNVPLIEANVVKHKTIWFDVPSNEMMLRHGTNIVRINRFSENILELKEPIFFNNIEDIKSNGFGILIDSITKKTIGCCVFTENGQSESNAIQLGSIHWVKTKEDLKRISSLFCIVPIVIDLNDIKNIFGITTNECVKKAQLLAEKISESGHHVILLNTCE